MPDFGWLSGEAFVKQATAQSISSLPAKHIHVDSDVQPTPAEQTCGQLYIDKDRIHSAVSTEPALRCPNCNEMTSGLASAQPAYLRDIVESGGKTHKGSLPKCPVPGIEAPYIYYTVEPCGCKVCTDWAGAFTAELQNRLQGNKPKAICKPTSHELQNRLTRLEQQLTKLYNAQALAGDSETKKDVDYWIVVIVDQMQRLCPGVHNKLSPKPLDLEVSSWASKHLFQVVSGSGVWLKPDGTYTNNPDDPGYPSSYKPPPGFKGAPAKKITAASLTCSFVLSPNFPTFMVRWSDGLVITYATMLAAKASADALMSSVSTIDRSRGALLMDILPDVANAIQAIAKKAQKDGTTAAIDELKEMHEVVCSGVKVPFGSMMPVIPELPKSTFEQIWNMSFPDKPMPDMKFEPLYQQSWSPESGPKPYTDANPTLPNLPNVTAPKMPEEINFFGALPEEKEVYVQRIKKIVGGTIRDAEYPKNLLLAVLTYFEFEKPFMTSLVQQEVMNGHGDMTFLLTTCAEICKDLTGYLQGKQQTLTGQTRRLIRAFVTHVKVEKQEAYKDMKPMSGLDPQRINRHHKKRRSIRPMGEE